MPYLPTMSANGVTATPGSPRVDETVATLIVQGQEITFPLLLDSDGALFIDIRKLQPT